MARPAAARAPEFKPKRDHEVEELRQELVRAFARRDAAIRIVKSALDAINVGGGGAPIGASYVTATLSGALTDERVLTGGTNVTITDNGAGSTIVIDVAGTSAEFIEDTVAALIDDTSSVVWTYTDGSSSLTAAVPAEFIQDVVGTMCVEGNGIDLVYNDGAGTLAIAVDESELAMQAPQYVTLANTAALPNERRLVEGNAIDITDGGAGSTVTVAVDETELDLISKRFVLIGGPGSSPLTNQRFLTEGHGIDLVDGGPASTITVEVDETELDGTLVTGSTRTLNKITTNLQVSSTSLTDIYSYAIPANTLTTGDILRVAWRGHFFNNDGANRSIQLTVVLGGVTIFDHTTATQTVSASRRALKITMDLAVQSNTLQIGVLDFFLSIANAATTGVGAINGAVNTGNQINATMETIDSTVNMTSAQTLQLRVALNAVTSTSNVYVRRRCAYSEKI